MGCAASTSISTQPRSSGGPDGCVKVLESIEVPEIGIAFVDGILQQGSGIFNTLAEINRSMTDRVDAIKECAGVDPDTTNVKNAIKEIVKGLQADDYFIGRLRGIVPSINMAGLMEGKLEFDFPVPEEVLASAGGSGLSEILQLGIDMVKACEEKLPVVISESSELAQKLGGVQNIASDPNQIKEQLMKSGLLSGNPLQDGPALMKAVSSLRKGVTACGKAPAAVSTVISNFKICCEAIVAGFAESSYETVDSPSDVDSTMPSDADVVPAVKVKVVSKSASKESPLGQSAGFTEDPISPLIPVARYSS